MDKPSKGGGLFKALAARLIRLERSMHGGSRSGRPPDMDEEADQDESDQEELVK
jgi:hypothetical protein